MNRVFLFCFILSLILIPATAVKAQCDLADTTEVSIGQLLADTAFCPSGGIITVNNVAGGGGEYVYELVSGPVVRIVQSQNIFYALPAGIYVVRVNGCNGTRKDTMVTIYDKYGQLTWWSSSVWKTGGLTCGITNDGQYTIKNNFYNLGHPPFRYQVSTGTDFTSVPYLTGTDSVVATGLLASTTYNLRTTDDCNNFFVTTFTTEAAVGSPLLSVPKLSFTYQTYYQCAGVRNINIDFKDSATSANYNPALAFYQTPYWGTLQDPHLRIQIKKTATNEILVDVNRKLRKSDWTFASMGLHYYLDSSFVDGQTGLAHADEVGYSMYTNWSPFGPANQIHTQYISTALPVNIPLTVSTFFPGGTYCGTTVPAYTKTYSITIPGNDNPKPVITSLTPVCSGNQSYIEVKYSADFIGKFFLIDPAPVYRVLQEYPGVLWGMVQNQALGSRYMYSDSLVNGHTYRVVLVDQCGRQDSMNILYSPGYAAPTPVSIQDTVLSTLQCNSLPTDSIYNIAILPSATSYTITKIKINGIADSLVQVGGYSLPSGYSNGYIQKPKLPPGTYTYTVYWQKSCGYGSSTKTVTISPITIRPHRAAIGGSVTTTASNCYVDGSTALNLSAYIKKGDRTSYTLANLRLTAVPNDQVFPLQSKQGVITSLETSSAAFGMSFTTTSWWLDSTYTFNTNIGLVLKPGQEGTYTFAVDVVCEDGTFVETVYKSFTVNSITEYRPGIPSLRNAASLLCDASTDLSIYLFTEGGKRPLTYEYKLESSPTYLLTGSAGADSLVTITPGPAAGTVYDIRVTDACGISSSSKVSAGSLTGQFYIYQTPLDCNVNPFGIRLATSSVLGAYYTWKRNGVVIAAGNNIYYTDITGVTVDSITVDIDIYGCYYRTGVRTITFDNPCGYSVLTVNNIGFSGTRLSASQVQLYWKVKEDANVKTYEIEKSVDGVHFSFASSINAIHLNNAHQYIQNDRDPSARVYYRLHIVDVSGRMRYSNIIKIEQQPIVKPTLHAVPNPAHDHITLFVNAGTAKQFNAKIYNDKGQLVKTVAIAASEITAGKQIDISALPNGNYYISLADKWQIVTGGRFVKL